MNLGFGSLASIFRPTGAPSQQQLNQQVAIGGGAETARDKLVRDVQRSRALKLTGAKVGERKVLDKAGVTKPAAAKRG
jgi:hypothetical protein